MKKIIIILTIVIVILIGVNIKQSIDIVNIKNKLGMNKTNEQNNAQQEFQKEDFISKEEFAKHIEKIELTTENWKDYIEIYIEDKERKNAWGEVTGIDTQKVIRLKEPYYSNSQLDSCVMDIEVDQSLLNNFWGDANKLTIRIYEEGKTYISNMSWENIAPEDIECTRIKGTIYYLKDVIWKEDGDGSLYIKVDSDTFYKEGIKLDGLNYIKLKDCYEEYNKIV